MTTYHIQIQAESGTWFDTPALRAGASVIDTASYKASTYPLPVMACTEAQQLANSLQATVRVVETTISVHDTFHPQEKQP